MREPAAVDETKLTSRAGTLGQEGYTNTHTRTAGLRSERPVPPGVLFVSPKLERIALNSLARRRSSATRT
jgi:hypothetical protein